MAAHQHVGAAAPGQVPPSRNDETRAQPGFIEGITEVDSGDCAAKLLARAARLGIEAHQLEGGAWLLRHALGASIGVVHGVAALDAALGGFEAVQIDVRDLMKCMRGAA